MTEMTLEEFKAVVRRADEWTEASLKECTKGKLGMKMNDAYSEVFLKVFDRMMDKKL